MDGWITKDTALDSSLPFSVTSPFCQHKIPSAVRCSIFLYNLYKMLRLHPSSILLSQEEVNKVLSAPCPSGPSPTSPVAPAWDAAIQSTRSRLHRKGKSPATQSTASSLYSKHCVLRIPNPPPSPASSITNPVPLVSDSQFDESSTSRSIPSSSPRSEYAEMDGHQSPRDFSMYYNMYEDTVFSEPTREPSEADYLADGEQSMLSINSVESEQQPLTELSRYPMLHNPSERERQLDGAVESDDGSSITDPTTPTPVLRLSTLRHAAIRNWAGSGAPVIVGDEQEGLVERRRAMTQRTEGQETRAPSRIRYQTPAWRRNLREVELSRMVDEDDMASDDSLSGVVLPPEMAAQMEERQRALQIEAARRTIR
jgi:hypothetical protein